MIMNLQERFWVAINTGFIMITSEILFYGNFSYSINFKLSRSWVTQPWIYPGSANLCIVKMVIIENIIIVDIFALLTLKVQILSFLYDQVQIIYNVKARSYGFVYKSWVVFKKSRVGSRTHTRLAQGAYVGLCCLGKSFS